ncbi:hypothetical protein IFR05_012183 [Cadophora sp. M221]|nr:hypothetical protein IFR05_012183 [Cadophora sp. M221]
MDSLSRPKRKATATEDEDKTMSDLPSPDTHVTHDQFDLSGTDHDSNHDLPPPAKKTNEAEKATQGYPVNADTSTAETEKLKETEVGYWTEQRKIEFEKSLVESQKFKAEVEMLKAQCEALQSAITSRDSMIQTMRPLVEVGAAVRARFMERSKKNAGFGEAMKVVVDRGDRAIEEGNLRADLAMIKLGYPFASKWKSLLRLTHLVVPDHPLIGQYDANTMYKNVCFQALYGSSFDGMIGHFKENFRAYPSKDLAIWEMAATMTSLTDRNNRRVGDYMSQFVDLFKAAQNEWTNHICRFWPDDQSRFNVASCWPPLQKIVRDMGAVVQIAVDKSKEAATTNATPSGPA